MTTRAFARFAFLDPLRFPFCGKLVLQHRFAVSARACLHVLVPDFAEAAAFFTRAMRRIERKQTRIEFFKRASAAWAAHLGTHHGQPILRIEQTRRAAPDFERAPHNVARIRDSLPIGYAHDNVYGVFLETLQFPKMRDRDQSSIDIDRIESLAFRPARHLSMKTFARFYQRRENLQRPALCSGLYLFHDRRHALFCHR
jgi:hypothetical protein